MDNENDKLKHRKVIYCKKCGSELDLNKKCVSCGKQYFKLRLPILYNILILLSFLIVISYESYLLYNSKKNDNNNIAKIEKLENANEDITKRLKEYIEYCLEEKDELNFFRNNAVIVSNNNTKKYHKYGCEDLMLNSFWIYNTEAAESDGYTMCKKCYNKQFNNTDNGLTYLDFLKDSIKYSVKENKNESKLNWSALDEK